MFRVRIGKGIGIGQRGKEETVRQHREVLERSLDPEGRPINYLFKMEDIRRALVKTSNTSPGEDQVC